LLSMNTPITFLNLSFILQLGFPTQSEQLFIVCSPIIYRGYA
jgi:hypothetical protein